MSKNAQRESISGNVLTKAMFAEMLADNFQKMPVSDQKFFLYGSMYLGMNSSFTGLISNNLYRRCLNVTQGKFSSALPMAVLPFLSTYFMYQAVVSNPLMFGDLKCQTCVLVRGTLVGLIIGGLHPILLALPLNVGLASRYNTTPKPETGNLLRYWMDVCRPVLKKMRAALLLQAFFGTYLSSRDFKVYTKLAEITFGSDGETLED